MFGRIKSWFTSAGGKPTSERLSNYRLMSVIGSGAMSEVWRAAHKKTYQTVAIKILSQEARPLIRKIESHYRNMTEGEIALLFDHPNIVRTRGWGYDGDKEFIVMELFEGVLLRDLLHEGQMDPRQNRMNILLQGASALEHIHERGIVHRDFCPRNILVNSAGEVKVFDFGLSVELELVKKTRGNRTGTLAYMAPELIRRQTTDQRCDIYALGITMYEMLAGQRPWIEIDNMAKLMQVMRSTPEPPSRLNPNISDELERIILKAIAKDPDQRYTTVRDFLDELEPVAEKEKGKWDSSPATPDTSVLRPEDLSA